MTPIKQHPKRRRSEIECGFCKEPTKEGIGICWDCQQIYKKGQQHDFKVEEDDKKYYFLRGDILRLRSQGVMPSSRVITGSHTSELTGTHYYRGLTFDFKYFIQLMFEKRLEPVTHRDTVVLQNNLDRFLGTVYYREDNGELKVIGDTNPFHSNSLYKIKLTEDQAKYLRNFIILLQEEIEYHKQEAYRKGSNLLVRMAEGDISIDDLNKKLLEREKKVYE